MFSIVPYVNIFFGESIKIQVISNPDELETTITEAKIYELKNIQDIKRLHDSLLCDYKEQESGDLILYRDQGSDLVINFETLTGHGAIIKVTLTEEDQDDLLSSLKSYFTI